MMIFLGKFSLAPIFLWFLICGCARAQDRPSDDLKLAKEYFASAEMLLKEGQELLENEQAVRLYRQAAQLGHKEAQETLGALFKTGLSGALGFGNQSQDGNPPSKAVSPLDHELQVLEKAAKDGNAQDKLVFAERLFNCPEACVNESKALQVYEDAALSGSAEAALFLGNYWKRDESTLEKGLLAAQWFEAAYDLGLGEGAHALGLIYHRGFGLEQDKTAAVEWFNKGATLNYGPSMMQLGIAYQFGSGAPIDLNKALSWYELANEQGMDTQDQIAALKEALANQEIIGFLQSVKENGSAQEALDVAFRFRAGEELPILFGGELDWLSLAAERGSAEAAYEIGRLFQEGKRISRDVQLAAEWFEKSALLGHAQSALILGHFYRQGVGGAVEPEQAADWFLRAAQGGNMEAQTIAAQIYANGWGRPVDLRLALDWAKKAKLSGAETEEWIRELTQQIAINDQLSEGQ